MSHKKKDDVKFGEMLLWYVQSNSPVIYSEHNQGLNRYNGYLNKIFGEEVRGQTIHLAGRFAKEDRTFKLECLEGWHKASYEYTHGKEK